MLHDLREKEKVSSEYSICSDIVVYSLVGVPYRILSLYLSLVLYFDINIFIFLKLSNEIV